MTGSEYYARLRAAGPEAAKADRLLEELRLKLDLSRKYGKGSLKLYGVEGTSIVFQPAPKGKETRGIRIQTRPDFPAEKAGAVRARVKQAGGDTHEVFSFIATDVLIVRWSEIRDVLLIPFLRDGH